MASTLFGGGTIWTGVDGPATDALLVVDGVVQAVGALKEKCAAVAAGRSMSLREVAEAEPGIRASARFSSELVFSSGAYGAVVEIEATAVMPQP